MKALTPNERRASSRFSDERTARRISGFLLLVLTPFAAQLADAQGAATRVETFVLPPNGAVRIENTRGATQVRTWDGQAVRIIAEKRGDYALEPSEMVLMRAGNTVVVQCRQTNLPGRIDLTAYVPSRCRLEITGGSWPVDVSGSLVGAAIETTNGNIGYAASPTDNVRFLIHSTRGIVRSTLALRGQERSGSHSIQGTLGEGRGQIVLNTQSGNITLMPAAAYSHSRAQAANDRSLVVSAAPASGDVIPKPLESAREWPGNLSATGVEDSAAGSAERKAKTSDSADDNEAIRAAQAPDDLRGRSDANSIGLAGSKRKSNGSSSTKSGPFERDQKQDTATEDSMGLSVRIIPSGRPAGDGARRPPAPQPGVDYTKYTYDGDGNLRPVERVARPSASNPAQGNKDGSTADSDPARPAQTRPDSSTSQGGSTSIGGARRNSNSTSSTKGGPFDRNRTESGYSDDSMGLSVKILPPTSASNQTGNRTTTPRTIYDADDDAGSVRSGSPSSSGADRSNSGDHSPATSTPRESQPAQRSKTRVDVNSRNGGDDITGDEPAPDPRSGPPPVLKRETDPAGTSSTRAGEANRRDASSDDKTLVLESALVNLNVSVTDRSGKAFGSLKREDFRVFENNEPQTVEFFAASNTPFNLVLLLDLSGSIKDKLKVIKSAALHFLDVIGPHDKVAVLAFTRTVRVISPLTGDRESLKNSIKNIEVAEGGTAFYEALWFAMNNALRGTQGQRSAIVVMTDGVDNSLQQERRLYLPSRVSYDRLKVRLAESDILVFPVYLDTEEEEVFERLQGSSQDYEIARMQLGEIAEESGGQMFVAKEAHDLAGVYTQVAAALRTVYSLGYYPTHTERDGGYRRVRVMSTRPEALVKARKGYYAR